LIVVSRQVVAITALFMTRAS